MRIVILTDKEERHFYFANKIIESTGCVVGVVLGGKYKKGTEPRYFIEKLFAPHALTRIKNRALNRIFVSSGNAILKEKRDAEESYFGGQREIFKRQNQNLVVVELGEGAWDINSPEIAQKIKSLNPDLVAVMGTALLKKEILAIAPCTLNIHTGLSPYYRGGFTNLWPFIFGEVGFFGVTVHKMSVGIDSGDIVFSARPMIEKTDTFSSINCKAIVLGTELMCRAIQLHSKGALKSIKQWTKGKLFNNRDFNYFVAFRYFRNRRNLLKRYCEASPTGFPEIQLVSADD